MRVPDQKFVTAVLTDFSQPLTSIVLGAWKDWQEWQKLGHGTWSKRGRANFMWEQMIERAKAAFATDARVRILEAQETVKFLADGKVLFRLKKGDEAGLSANYPTQLALAFHDHEVDLLGMTEAARVDIVYKLNKLETLVQDILIVARDNDAVAWTESIMHRGATVTDLAVPPKAPAAPKKKLVRPRDEADKKKTDTQG